MRPRVARFSHLEEWLAWQENAHWPRIDPGLVRTNAVLRRMALDRPSFRVITVGGTNGKGSTVALLEAILLAAGYRVGSYTSPHLLRYNERIKVQGMPLADEVICHAFARIDAARGDISLTYFEFSTLAAIDIFHQMAVDIALLEVGLGGRLDAVNSMDADVAVIATVGIDHVKWLGPDREVIGFEKAGIFRPYRPAVCGDLEPPASLEVHAARLATPLYRLNRDYHYEVTDKEWSWRSNAIHYTSLPPPALKGSYQYQNAATALMALQLMGESLSVTEVAVHSGLRSVSLPGRFQRFPGEVERFFDVAHNPLGAQVLAQSLSHTPCRGRTRAVFGMLADKDVAGVTVSLQGIIDEWYLGGLEGERGLAGKSLAGRMGNAIGAAERIYPTVGEAYRRALEDSRSGDRIIVFGSFHTVETVLRLEGWDALSMAVKSQSE